MIHNSSLARYGYAARNKKVLSCFLNSTVSRVDLMSTGSLFHAFGAATSKALSDETSLVLRTSSSCLPTERSETRPGIAVTRGHQLRDIGWGSTADYMMYEKAEFELDP